MTTILSGFKEQDLVVCKEDIYSIVYDRVFGKGHEFEVITISPMGLTIEDRDGYRLRDMGFLRFEVKMARGDYRKNNSNDWYMR